MIELWTIHLLHWGWQHALLNGIAAVPPVVAMPRHRRWLFLPFLLIAAPLIALVVRSGFAGEYRGASGLVVAMWVFAGVLLRNRVVLIAIAVKLAAEAFGFLPSHEGYVTVALAHYAGAAAGVLGGLAMAVPLRRLPWSQITFMGGFDEQSNGRAADVLRRVDSAAERPRFRGAELQS